MIPYFGSKKSKIKYYPRPMYDRIIEPFAGSAQYALRYWDRDVLIVDKYDVLIKLWKWLQVADPGYIRHLPRLECGQTVDDLAICDEAKALLGFIISVAVTSPRKTAQKMATTHRPNHQNFILNEIASNLHKIRKWDIRLGSYEDIPNEKATWFIDPPYQVMGNHYIHGSKNIDYSVLAEWCKSRSGQAIVCESEGASWLPFHVLGKNKGARSFGTEMVWSNEPMLMQASLWSAK